MPERKWKYMQNASLLNAKKFYSKLCNLQAFQLPHNRHSIQKNICGLHDKLFVRKNKQFQFNSLLHWLASSKTSILSLLCSMKNSYWKVKAAVSDHLHHKFILLLNCLGGRYFPTTTVSHRICFGSCLSQ